MGLRALNNTDSSFEEAGTGSIGNLRGAPATGIDASGGTGGVYV